MTHKTRFFCIASLIMTVLIATETLPVCAQQESEEIRVIADQLRSQGYACNNPSSAVRMAAESTPGEPTYLVTCENATYQVQLTPDQAAHVVQIK